MIEYKLQSNIDNEYKRKNIVHKHRSKNDIVSFSVFKRKKNDTNIVGYVRGKNLASDNDDYLLITSINGYDYRYKVTDKSSLFVNGYIPVGDNNYLGYISNKFTPALILLLATLVGLFLISSLLNSKGRGTNSYDYSITVSGSGITDIEDMLRGKSKSHSMSVPQFSSLFIYKGTYIPLVNLPSNDVMIMYEVYDLNNNLVFSSDEPLVPNSEDKWYLENYELGVHEFIVKAFKVDGDLNKGNSVSFNTSIHILE